MKTVIAESVFELGDKAVPMRLFAPLPDRESFRCDYEIDWPENSRHHYAMGVDSLQALTLALQKAHVDLLAGARDREVPISWYGGEEPGLPLPKNLTRADFDVPPLKG